MTDWSELPQALNEMRNAIVRCGNYIGDAAAAEIAKTIAEDFEFNPILLIRKFEEKFGVAPGNYARPPGEEEALQTQRDREEWRQLARQGMRAVGLAECADLQKRVARMNELAAKHPGWKHITLVSR